MSTSLTGCDLAQRVVETLSACTPLQRQALRRAVLFQPKDEEQIALWDVGLSYMQTGGQTTPKCPRCEKPLTLCHSRPGPPSTT